MAKRSRTGNRKPLERTDSILRLGAEDVVALRKDGSNRPAFDRIVRACEAWVVATARQPLSRDDHHDIVCSAITEMLLDLRSEEVSLPRLCDRLQRVLGHQRLRRERQIALLQPLSEYPIDSLQVPPSARAVAIPHFWVEVVHTIEGFMVPALLSLSPRDQDLVVRCYGLDDLRDPTRPPEILDFHSVAEEKRALGRARRRFNALLEENLLLALKVLEQDRHLLEAALKIVRAEALDPALAAVREWEGA